ncbi:hypothetical protein LSAT2_027402 [Lamellibrachia satsuma]|nr:hypothetical protein LSAT2_027402 [Lamellibrachia satsuma]
MTTIDQISAIPKDTGWAWMCLIGGLLMNTIMAGGIFKTFGVIFITVEAKYDASAAFLSWTPSIAVSLAFLMGPLANALASRFCTRWLVITGAFLVSTGYVLSSLAGSQWVFFCTYGICIGVGSSLVYSPSIVVVNQYFEKKRGVANGVSLAGSGIGSMAIPPLMVYTLDTYGYVRPFWMGRRNHREVVTSNMRQEILGMQRMEDMLIRLLWATPALIKTLPVIRGVHINQNRLTKESLQRKEVDSEASDEVNGTNEELNDVVIVQLCVGECRSYTDAQANDKDDTTTEQLRSSAISTDCPIKTDNMGVSVIDTDYQSIHDAPSTTDINGTSSDNQPSKHPLIEWRLLTNPVLVIYSLSMGMAASTYFDFFIMATPHAEQLGFSRAKAALLISMMGAADMFSRVATGVFADLNFVRKRHIFHASLALSSVVFLVLPSLKTYPTIAIACVLFSVAGGGYISVLPTLLAEELGIERIHTTFGMSLLIVGCADLVVPAVMGKLRDITGTWDGSFYACGGLMAAVSFLNLLLPVATKAGQSWLKVN